MRAMMIAAVCLLLAGVPARGDARPAAGESGAGKEREGAASPLPPGVYARVNGQDITEEEYARYLLASLGKSRLGEYVDRKLIEARARREGVVVTPEEVESLVEERVDRTIQGIYRGNRESFLEGLAKQDTTLEERKARWRQEIYYDRLLEKLILKGRQVTEEAVREEFERKYGPGGVRYEIRHLLISTAKRIDESGNLVAARSEAEAGELAGKVHQELLAGGDFIELVKRYSDDTFTKRNDGRIPLYREGFYGPEFHAAVEKLTAENPLSGVVRSRRGFHLIQLIGKSTVRFEDEREKLAAELRQRPPSARERHEALRALREEATIVR